jgi:hypothetical protein
MGFEESKQKKHDTFSTDFLYTSNAGLLKTELLDHLCLNTINCREIPILEDCLQDVPLEVR